MDALKNMLSKSKNEFIILACKEFPQGNAALQGFCAHLKKFLAERGVECEAKIVPWRELNLSNLSENSVLLPLAVWDYSKHYDEFLRFLDEIERLNLRIFNPLALLRWNLSKLYLKELENLGFDIIPSVFIKPNEPYKEHLNKWQNPIIKPLIGQSGNGVRRLNEKPISKNEQENGFIIQKFIPEICDKGELCLIFFNAKFQYAITRKVAKNDFRANSQFGASIEKCEIIDQKCLSIAKEIFKHLPQTPLYARIDFITLQEKVLINELELIEPNLYFLNQNNAIQNFCEAVFASLKHRI